jgi:hypothetical protein
MNIKTFLRAARSVDNHVNAIHRRWDDVAEFVGGMLMDALRRPIKWRIAPISYETLDHAELTLLVEFNENNLDQSMKVSERRMVIAKGLPGLLGIEATTSLLNNIISFRQPAI